MTALHPHTIFLACEAAAVDQLLKGRYSARYYLPDKIDKATIENIVDAANNAPSGNNMQPWKVYCVAGDVKDAISAQMVEAHDSRASYAPRYTYYPPTLPPEYAIRRREFGKHYYGHLGIDYDDVEGREADLRRNYEFFDAPVALIFTVNSELREGSWMDLGHFMQSISIGARARGLESVTQLSVPKFDEIIRKHIPIRDDELVAASISMGYPDLEKIAQYYARPAKKELREVLEIHGM
ncbi:Nitroreductase [Mycena venus]|uniref:Nitroreductase n=1 Tax=Mycena venus TaxID=2733690 RepID=A0A8H7CGF2_9AGAR|nr:Nitroreductase [Mycena venus]